MNALHPCLTDTPPLLPYPSGCRAGRLIRREKRFSMAVELTEADGSRREVWAHTNNTGSMLGLLRPGSPVLLSPAAHPGRKLLWTVEAIGLPFLSSTSATSYPTLPASDLPSTPHFWIGVNTSVPNRFLSAAFKAGLLFWAAGYTDLRREAVNGESRLDGLCTGPNLPSLWIECKNVTLVEDGRAAFPDAITERGAKHLGTLQRLVRQGSRAAMLYLVQRPDGLCFGPADYIDPVYAAEYGKARENGVEIHALVASVSPLGVSFSHYLPLGR